MRKLVVVLLLTAAGLIGCNKEDRESAEKPVAANSSQPESIEVSIVTSDSLTQTAWFTPTSSQGQKAPLIITLPMLNQRHESFDKFVDEVRAYIKADTAGRGLSMPNLLSFDLRGHGKSTVRGSEVLNFMTMGDENFAKIPQDVSEMTARILADYSDLIDTGYIVAVAASVGANSAMLLTEQMPYIRKVVLLSVGIDYLGMQPLEAFKAYQGQVLFVACKGDENALESSRTIATSKDDNWLMKSYFGKHHGTRILNSNPTAMSTVIEWVFSEEGAAKE